MFSSNLVRVSLQFSDKFVIICATSVTGRHVARKGSRRPSNKVPRTEFANITRVNNSSSRLYHIILSLSLSLFLFIYFSTISFIVAFVLHTSPHLQFQCSLPVITNAIDFYARVYCSQSRPPSSISVTIFVDSERGSTGCSIVRFIYLFDLEEKPPPI